MGNFEEAKKILNSREGKALLDLIAFTEGTSGVSQNGYDVVVSFKKIIDWNDNYTSPHKDAQWKQEFQNGSFSTASGRYQFLGSTWKSTSEKVLNITNAPFNKKNQNLFGAFKIYSRTKSNQTLSNGSITIPKPPALTSLTKSNFFMLLDALAPEWASFPFSQNGGTGFYSGQNTNPKKNSAAKLWDIYQQALAKY